MPISNIVVAIAMEAEATPFIDHLQLQRDEDFFPKETPFHAFRGKHKSCNLTVITNGKDEVYGTGVDNVGTVPAALATFLSLQKMKNGNDAADLLINAGTCGKWCMIILDVCVGMIFAYVLYRTDVICRLYLNILNKLAPLLIRYTQTFFMKADLSARVLPLGMYS